MRKNRKIPKKMSVVASNTMHFGAVIVILSVMVILNLLASSSCTQLMKTIGEKERELVKLEDSKMRESTRWEEMKTPERVEESLRAHGLAMAAQIHRKDAEAALNEIPCQLTEFFGALRIAMHDDDGLFCVVAIINLCVQRAAAGKRHVDLLSERRQTRLHNLFHQLFVLRFANNFDHAVSSEFQFDRTYLLIIL